MSPIRIEENELLAPCTSLGIGGPARFLVRARSEEEIFDALEYAKKRGCPVLVLGGGSNIVVSDHGFPGLVLKIELSGFVANSDGGASAGAGEQWDGFVRYCIERNLAGIECLSGIPGTVGGTPVQNVGAYGQDVSGVISRVRLLDRTSGSITSLDNAGCRFGYRTSIFNTAERDRYIILRIDFVLKPGGEARLDYQDLQRHFSHSPVAPSLAEVREAVLSIRAAKGMVLSDLDPESKSAGSFFKNPIVNTEQAAALEEKARSLRLLEKSERLPVFAASSGQLKIAAAWLVERAGFPKGYTAGRVGISCKHSLALVNRGGARAEEIIHLMRRIQESVQALFGIELQQEPIFIGFEEEAAFNAGRFMLDE